MNLNCCDCGGEVDVRFGGHGAKFYTECRECGKTVDLEAVDMPGAVQEWNNRKGKTMKNYIPEIIEMLGVEIGEKFRLKDNGRGVMPDLYRFTETKFEYFDTEEGWQESMRLTDIILGESEIVRSPYEPKQGDNYWTIVWKKEGATKFIEARSCTWGDVSVDYLRKILGLVYRSYADAEADKYKAFERAMQMKWGEW